MEGPENKIPNKHGPCLDKKCSFCCNPVLMPFRKGSDPRNIPTPKKKEGEELWTRDKVLIDPNLDDDVRLQSYNCVNFDPKTGLCKDHENRPDICRNSSCIDENSTESIDIQHKRVTESKLYNEKDFLK